MAYSVRIETSTEEEKSFQLIEYLCNIFCLGNALPMATMNLVLATEHFFDVTYFITEFRIISLRIVVKGTMSIFRFDYFMRTSSL